MRKFFKEIAFSLNPGKYGELRHVHPRVSIAYFFKLLLLSILLFVVFAIPTLYSWPDFMQAQMQKLESFTLNVDIQQTEPILFTLAGTRLVIDTNSNLTEPEGKEVLVTKKEISVQRFGKEFSLQFGEYKDMLSKKKELAYFSLIRFLLFLPSLLLLLYLFYVIKFALLVALFVLIGALALVIGKKKIDWIQIMNTGVFALTPLILVKKLILPFVVFPYVYFIPLLFFLIYFFYGLFGPNEKKGYVEL